MSDPNGNRLHYRALKKRLGPEAWAALCARRGERQSVTLRAKHRKVSLAPVTIPDEAE